MSSQVRGAKSLESGCGISWDSGRAGRGPAWSDDADEGIDSCPDLAVAVLVLCGGTEVSGSGILVCKLYKSWY